MIFSAQLKAVYQFVDDVVKVDTAGNVQGDYREQLELAKLIAQRVASFEGEWPLASRKFLALAAELAVCFLIHDRSHRKPEGQPGLPLLLREIGYEATDPLPPADELAPDQFNLQQSCIGICKFASLAVKANDHLKRRAKGR